MRAIFGFTVIFIAAAILAGGAAVSYAGNSTAVAPEGAVDFEYGPAIEPREGVIVLPENGSNGVVLRDREGRVLNSNDDSRGRIRIDSIDDLAGLTDQQIRDLESGRRGVDADTIAIRDDMNRGLHRLARSVRGLNYSYRISGVRNASGTAAVGGSGYSDMPDYEFVPAQQDPLRRRTW